MRIINKLSKNKTALLKIEKLFVKLGEELGNINEFPLHIPRFFSPDKDSSTKLGVLLKQAFVEISKLAEFSDLENIIIQINKIDSLLIFFAKGSKDEISKESLIIHLIAREVELYVPKISDYINLIPQEQKVFKELRDLDLDKYNLTTITNDFKLENHGIIYKDKFLLYYHPFLRRFYTSNFTIGGLLKKITGQKNISLKIAIDPVRLSDPIWLKNIIEADYWQGPIFSKSKLNDPNFVGTTVYARNAENQQTLDFTWPVVKTVFYITNKKESGLKQIEIEEINPQNDRITINNKYVFQKYAHFIWDAQTNTFNHFDVAVKVYSLSEHLKRLQYDWETRKILDPGKPLCKIKLFRLDGKIDASILLELLGDFFRYNELINEFFESKLVSDK